MAKLFEIREVGTGRLLGRISTVDDVRSGQLLGMLRGDQVQVDLAPPAPVADNPKAGLAACVADPVAEELSGRGKRRAKR